MSSSRSACTDDRHGAQALWATIGATKIYRGAQYAFSFLPKLKIEVAVAANNVDRLIEAITNDAKTGPDRRRQDFRPQP
jgi:nitrogen regulatory protein PII